MLMLYPVPAATDTLTIYYIPVPSAMSASGDDPSTASLGGIPAQLHPAIEFYACARAASYDDDQSSAQGQRYLDRYQNEIRRYRLLMKRRGGRRMPRAQVGRPGTRIHHTNDVYP